MCTTIGLMRRMARSLEVPNSFLATHVSMVLSFETAHVSARCPGRREEANPAGGAVPGAEPETAPGLRFQAVRHHILAGPSPTLPPFWRQSFGAIATHPLPLQAFCPAHGL